MWVTYDEQLNECGKDTHDVDLVTGEEQCGPGTQDIQVHRTVGFGTWEGKSATRADNTHIKASISRHAHRYLKERVQSMFFVSTGSHNNLSQNFPACTTEGKADAFDVRYTESNHLEMGFSFF